MADQNGTTPAVEAAESAARALVARAKEAREIATRLEAEAAKQHMDNLAIRFYVRNCLQPTLNNPEEAHAALLRMYTKPDSGIIDFTNIEQLAIRFAVKKWMEMEYIDANLDEEDAATLLSLLLEIDIADHYFLFSEDRWERELGRSCDSDIADAFKNSRLVPDGNKRRKISGDDDAPDHTTSPRTKRGDRISTVNLIGQEEYDQWEFHTPRTFKLLARLDKLETLTIENCSAFRVSETISYKRDSQCTFGSPAILNDRCNPSNLEMLNTFMTLDEDTLATLLFDILPHCPKLQRVDFKGYHRVKSFQKIARRIDEEESTLAVKSLRYLDLGNRFYGPIPDAKELSRLHNTHDEFGRIPFCQNDRLRALMEINKARCMLDDFAANSSNRNSTIPLSLWPPIITKAKSPDVIFFLLQNSAALRNG
eukprot:CAMPEP_0116125818 /NCGR_PEP_ID=MMETSP0329-20121206/6008_1 /TAXON_ID=697910 /ORGANISM="Pseudo-nitzschia arenysensis, Strain B593" /LENGTH=423 /DNA_ID=CAMNT_0003619873 /DNA_START=46 /DNA_END=1314 /DNA_ORIENTATION=-